MKYIIGTRGSRLALKQVDIISKLLKEKSPDLEFERKIIRTTGDKILDAPLSKIGGKGIFVKEIDEAVKRGDVDFAVHSMKDVPTDILDELEIVSVPKREDVNDALISKGPTLDELAKNSVVGTSSLRRRAEILNYRGDLEIKDLRGNVDTRIRKVMEGNYDAIIMAKAGLKRLGFERHITQVLDKDVFIPSVGQGAIAVVSRKAFEQNDILTGINDEESMQKVLAERALLKYLGGGCQVPIGAVTETDIEKRELRIKAVIISPDGRRRIEVVKRGSSEKPEKIGTDAAKALLKAGGDVILEEV
jgi:hydroxymethylbilane synthase